MQKRKRERETGKKTNSKSTTFDLLLPLPLQASSSSSSSIFFLPGVKQDIRLARLDGFHRDPLDVRVRGPEPGEAPLGGGKGRGSSGRSGGGSVCGGGSGRSVSVFLVVSFFATGEFDSSSSVALGVVVNAVAVGERARRSLRFRRRRHGPFPVVAAAGRSRRSS